MTRKIPTSRLVQRGALSAVILSAALALPAAADWLVTLEGQLVETQGPWKVDGDAVFYVDADGKENRVAVADIDLEGSADTTEVRTGHRPELPAPPPPKADEKKEVQAEKTRPDVILYATSWCGYCRKTRQLLRELEADFVEKDIEKDPAAGREFHERFGRSGVPVIDVAGEVIWGYDHKRIREAVLALRREGADV